MSPTLNTLAFDELSLPIQEDLAAFQPELSVVKPRYQTKQELSTLTSVEEIILVSGRCTVSF